MTVATRAAGWWRHAHAGSARERLDVTSRKSGVDHWHYGSGQWTSRGTRPRDGYDVHWVIRGQSNIKAGCSKTVRHCIKADLIDLSSIIRETDHTDPEELYKLAAVGYSFKNPTLTPRHDWRGGVELP